MRRLVVVGVVSSVLVPRVASACGGLFCDGGAMPMPVDQSGENILFVRDGDSIEAHIQIQYFGDADQFAWVIPLQSVPELSVGSDPLFQALLAASVPTYGFTTTFDDCGFGGSNGSTMTSSGGSSMSSTAADESGGDDGGGGPEILLTETVGAFEITVLQGGDAMEVYDWLGANGYQQDPDALPILGEYIDEGLLFGAIKLSGGADVDEIHPIVLRFVGDEPCVPLRLTRIAAVDDMAVRAFFLGEARMVPLNYRHVLVNQVEVNWLAPTNYPEVVTLAVDEENADGRAFVTEYAGTSAVVPTGGLFSASWDAQAFAGADVSTVGTTLQAQSLLVCDDFSGCAFTHPLIEGLLGEYVMPPDGVPSADFWANFDAYSVDTSAWDGAAFAANMATRIVEPGMHAMELLGAHSYLTRMFTTISPAEMTEDPQFWENAALPDVPNLLNGTLRMLCNNDRVFTLPDGREVYLPSGTTWPDFPSMPQSEMIEAVPNAGAPMTLTDNGALIDEILAAWNAAHGWPASGGDGSGSASASASGSGSDSDGSSSAGADATTERGCGCVADARAMPWWSLIVLLGLRRRRIC